MLTVFIATKVLIFISLCIVCAVHYCMFGCVDTLYVCINSTYCNLTLKSKQVLICTLHKAFTSLLIVACDVIYKNIHISWKDPKKRQVVICSLFYYTEVTILDRP
jgi:hypothetical protein